MDAIIRVNLLGRPNAPASSGVSPPDLPAVIEMLPFSYFFILTT